MNLIARKEIKKGDVVVRVFKDYCRPTKERDVYSFQEVLGIAKKDCRKGQECDIIADSGEICGN